MMQSKFKIKSATVVTAGVALALSGCSSTHSDKWNESNRNVELDEAMFDNVKTKVAPKDRPLTRIIDDFYVDTSPMVIIKESKSNLPSIFHKRMVFFGDEPILLTDLAGDVYRNIGVSIEYINNEKVTEEEESESDDEADIVEAYVPPTSYFDSNSEQTESEVLEEEEPAALETEDSIYIDSDKTLKELLDFVSVKKGYKWRYDQASNKVFVYKYDTKTFTLFAFAEAISRKSSITTSLASSSDTEDGSGSSSTENEQSISIDSQTAYWESVKESVKEVISEKGTVTFNDVQGKIVVTDNDFVLSNVNGLIRDLNKDGFREIALKVQVVNVTMNDKRDLSASFDIQSINDKFAVSFGDAVDLLNPVKSSINFSDGKTSTMLSLLDSLGNATVENNVNVAVLNNMPVPLQLTQNRSYVESVSLTTDDDTGEDTSEVEVATISEGITMTLTPKAIGQNVMLDYSLNLSSIDSIEEAGGDAGSNGVQLPITSTKNFVQRSSLRNGVPRVLVTVERKTTSSASSHPLNENLWFLGGSEGIDNKRDVLMVIVTPYITDLIR